MPAQSVWQGSGFAADQTNAMLAVGGTSCISLISVAAADENSLTPLHRLLPAETQRSGFGGSPVGGGDKNSCVIFFTFLCGGYHLPSGCCGCVGTTRRGVYFSRKNGFLRVGALRRRTRCSLLHTALFRRSCMGVVSLPSACASCCRNAGRPQVTVAYLPFLCRHSARPVWAEYPHGGVQRHPSPEPRTQRLTGRNGGRSHRLRHRQGR